MKILVTGASGYIGHKLAHMLAAQGHTVHAFIRNPAASVLLQHPNIIVFSGDVVKRETLLPAIAGCQQLYHTAAKVGAWAHRPQAFYDVNVMGTAYLLDAAREAGVEKVVFTSTAGVLGPSAGQPADEQHQRTLPILIDYDRSKKEAEELVNVYVQKGLPVVVVSPAKVFGPGHTSHSLTANAIINSFLQKGVAFIPSPGTCKVCFAYVDDVVRGHVQAMEKGQSGETYLLGGNNVSYAHLFGTIRKLAGGKGRIIALPKAVVKAAAFAQETSHYLFGSNVRFPVASVDHLFSNYIFSSEKAIRHLHYSITPLEEALWQTIQFLKKSSPCISSTTP